jgi:hypothetical protein
MRPALPVLAALVLAAPLAAAGIALPGTPAGDYCFNVNTDTCVAGPYTSTLGYGFGFQGVFVGTAQLVMDAPGYHHVYTCKDMVLAGVLPLSTSSLLAECDHDIAPTPPAGVPITMTCTSEGTGVVNCYLMEG